MSQPIGAFETAGPLMKRCFRALLEALANEMKNEGVENLSASVLTVFSHLGGEKTRMTDLAESLAVTKQSAGQMVKELQLMGYLALETDPEDRRAKLIVITEKGKELRVQIRKAKQKIDSQILTELTQGEVDVLYDSLSRVLNMFQTKKR